DRAQRRQRGPESRVTCSPRRWPPTGDDTIVVRPVSIANLPQPEIQHQINSAAAELEREVSRRRTFAIISHPDAGKTTLTEKLLLYAGAIELAGAVRGRRDRKKATSDWMALEQERGISITAAAPELELERRRLAVIATPGHKDS